MAQTKHALEIVKAEIAQLNTDGSIAVVPEHLALQLYTAKSCAKVAAIVYGSHKTTDHPYRPIPWDVLSDAVASVPFTDLSLVEQNNVKSSQP